VLKNELLKQYNTELICRGTLAVRVYFKNHELLLARASCIIQALLARCNEFVPPDSSPLVRKMKRFTGRTYRLRLMCKYDCSNLQLLIIPSGIFWVL